MKDEREHGVNNLKKPLFWAYAIVLVYLFIGAIVQVFIGPFSTPMKIVSGIEAILYLVVLVLYAFSLLPYTNVWKYIPLMIGVIFLFNGPLFSSGGYNDQWLAFLRIHNAFTPVVGLFMIIFSVIHLVLEKKKIIDVASQNTPSK